ncbi:MAG: YHS domain-containing (seleno)protein [Pseudomonadota bacterium]
MKSEKLEIHLFLTLFFVFCVFFTSNGHISESHANPRVWQDHVSGYAIGGYDPVAYYTQGKAVKGRDAHQARVGGNSWKFYNVGNLEVFERHPQAYVPGFSGYDVFALSKGDIIKGLPTIWVKHKEKIYFFQNIINLSLWRDDPDAYIEKAKERQSRLDRYLSTHTLLD